MKFICKLINQFVEMGLMFVHGMLSMMFKIKFTFPVPGIEKMI